MHANLKRHCLLFGACACLAWCSALQATRADQPLEVPQSRKLSSGSPQCWAYTDANARKTTAYRLSKEGKPVEIWSVDGWFRVAAISGDCEYLVTGYDGVNLLPIEYSPTMTMLTFYRRGKVFATVRLKQLVLDRSKLERTASHWRWGAYIGVERRKFYRVETIDRGQLVFDMTSGRLEQ